VEFESYQRGQALALVRDMESRLRASRATVTGYLDNAVSSTDGSRYFGVGGTDYSTSGNCPTGGGTAVDAAKFNACTWGRTLQGAADGSSVGVVAGARGCLMRVVPANASALADVYIVVVWQGTDPSSEPPAASPAGQCASGIDFGAGRKRGVSMRVLIPDLQLGV
jgi:type IV pilus assembly protein PilV